MPFDQNRIVYFDDNFRSIAQWVRPFKPIFALGVTQQILGLTLGVTQICAFLDTNMFVSPSRNRGVGV